MGFMPAVSLTAQIADHIGERIIDGALGADERIQELRVAKDLGVSRGSVREALLILESRGLVRILPRRGALVSELGCRDIADLAEVSAELLVLLFKKLAKHFDACSAVDQSPFHLGLERARVAADAGSMREFMEGKFDFLNAALELVSSPYLAGLIEDLMPSWRRLSTLVHRHRNADLHDNMRFTQALWQAVQSGDCPRVEELLRAHCKREARLAQEVLTA